MCLWPSLRSADRDEHSALWWCKTISIKVFTADKDPQKIIKVNDYLVAQNKDSSRSLFIDYFDDKALATSYFEKQNSSSITEKEKDKMFLHYIANMKYNVATSYKVLSVNKNGDWVELKKY